MRGWAMELRRLEELFGSVWQAALDHAGVLSRRRAREIGAGQEASEALEATIELLERLPPAEWPPRWRGLGKASETCPTLLVPRLSGMLVDGMIDREHAVVVWDDASRGGDPAVPVRNVAVGLYPRGAFEGLPRDDPDRTRWQIWNRQWGYSNGVPLTNGILRTGGATPEGIAAQWIHRDGLAGEPLEAALAILQAKVAGFSRRRVLEFVEQYGALDREGETDPEDEGPDGDDD